ncbi:MAG TPA: SUMF1/EgtB/PvdO family nonheme iron enzyme [Flavobacterium sp.]|nr:SUMF1/EgtB/PvdO family nonheme iron enzyme [Flavobacterium sp.]
MKTKLAFLLMLLTLLEACGKKDSSEPDPPPVVVSFLDLSMTTINFKADKDASLVVVRTDEKWDATCPADWISLSAYNGNESTGFIIGASANKKFVRETTVTISGNKKSKEIKIKQTGVSKVSFEINGVPFTLLPVDADFSFYLTGGHYLATPKVYLDSYFISETEITNAQWNAIMDNLPYETENNSPNLPVVVNWKKITDDFIPKINTLSEYKFRLPTEKEWEVAARGGKKSKNTSYAGSMYVDEVAWYWNNAEGKKHNVASKTPNELGLYDMSGNVSEWCSDWYAEWTEANRPPAESTNPTGPTNGTEKVILGGDYNADHFEYDKNSCQIGARNHLPPDIDSPDFLYDGHYHQTGFRLVIPKN